MIDLVLKWSPRRLPDTIERHRTVALERGSVWWGRQTYTAVIGSAPVGLGEPWLQRVREQVAAAQPTYVFLHSSVGGTWCAHLLAIATDIGEVDVDLVPSYYDLSTQHSLWVKLTQIEKCDPAELTERYVLARTGAPVTWTGLNNQTPLIVLRTSIRP